jgi:hypothetical protein
MANPFTPEQISQILEAFFETVGTRQYIGARYVPIFGRKGEASIIWDNSAPYEPLTIVLYQGNSFTSRQYVPEGVEITNELFWANTGNYNAQVEQYRRETQRVADALPVSDFDEQNTVKGYIDAGNSALDVKIDTNAENITNLQTGLSNEITARKLDIEKAHVFDTVADMKASQNLSVGAICHTNGFNASGDGGAAWYEINETGTANEMDVIACGDTLRANLVVNEYVTPEMLGAHGNGNYDDTKYLSKALTYHKVMFNAGNTYLISEPISSRITNVIDGNGSTLLLATMTEFEQEKYAITLYSHNNITVKNLSIVAQSSNLTDFEAIGQHDKAPNETTSSWSGIRFRGCSSVVVEECNFQLLDFGIALLPGAEVVHLKQFASTNVVISSNSFVNVKNAYIFEYCNNVRFDKNVYYIDMPTSDGAHIYYLEAYVGDVSINDELANISPSVNSWTAYNFASYGAIEENDGRNIVITNTNITAPRMFGLRGHCELHVSDCVFESNITTDIVTNVIYINNETDPIIDFSNCTFRIPDNMNGALYASDQPSSLGRTSFKSCHFLLTDGIVQYSNDAARFGTVSLLFVGCTFECKKMLTRLPVHGNIEFVGCTAYGPITFTPSFITSNFLESDAFVSITNCLFVTTVDSNPASITGPNIQMGRMDVFGCQLKGTNISPTVLFRTQPTNKANNYLNFTLDA